jgi:cell division protein FtsL
MSVPARSAAALPEPAIGRRPARRGPAEPVRRPSAGRPSSVRRPTARTAAAPTRAAARRRTRRGFHPAFWALTAAILTAIVVALVSVSALVVETGFGVDRTEARIAQLLDEGERLRRDVAAMSAPGRIATWAKRSGLVMPEEVVVLQVPGNPSAASDAPDGAQP